MKNLSLVFLVLFFAGNAHSQATTTVNKQTLRLTWATGPSTKATMILDLEKNHPLIKSISTGTRTIATGLDPAWVLTVGKRTLSPSSGGWDVFFDKVPDRPYQSYRVEFQKTRAKLTTSGSHTIIKIGELHAASFKGDLEITIYNGTPCSI
ncbi:hypothetical protein ACQ86N_46735 [Puia sp. P3]|uniref:hypothetical protein n=1 Tax=Puia sp. P3 TaxID=3423952 RepID=UPI003D66B908